jgi:hypothetical protein
MSMSVVLIVASLWVVLAPALALFLGRAMRRADARKAARAVPLRNELLSDDAAHDSLDPLVCPSGG